MDSKRSKSTVFPLEMDSSYSKSTFKIKKKILKQAKCNNIHVLCYTHLYMKYIFSMVLYITFF